MFVKSGNINFIIFPSIYLIFSMSFLNIKDLIIYLLYYKKEKKSSFKNSLKLDFFSYNPSFAISSAIFFFSSSLISAGGAAETAIFEVLGVSSVKSKSPSSRDTLAST